MSAQPHSNWFSLGEYFALELASERRFEYRNGEILCMSGWSRHHTTIGSNAFLAVGKKLKSPCRFYGADACIYVPAGLPYRYADVSIVCGEPSFGKSRRGSMHLRILHCLLKSFHHPLPTMTVERNSRNTNPSPASQNICWSLRIVYTQPAEAVSRLEAG